MKRNRPGSQGSTVVGIAWYRADQWAWLHGASIDRGDLEVTHEEWERGANKRLRELRAKGLPAQRFDVDVEDLIRWCELEGCAVDGRSRSRYVAEKLRATVLGG
jgi:hypothetical protein